MTPSIKITDSASVAIIDIDGIIGAQQEDSEKITTYSDFENAIKQINNLNAEEIIVNIRSTGGSVNDALLIYDSLCSLKAKITTRCYGYVASAATIIAQAANKGKREISSNALYLIHCSESICEGNAKSIVLTKELLEQTDRRIADIYASRSGFPKEQFTKLMNENGGKGRWLSPNEAIEKGLADKIIPSAEITNDSLDQVKKLGLPPIPETNKEQKRFMQKVSACCKDVLNRLGFATENTKHTTQTITSEKTLNLNERITSLFENNTSLPVQTKTKQKEDPSVYEYSCTPNTAAYDADIYSIMSEYNRN